MVVLTGAAVAVSYHLTGQHDQRIAFFPIRLALDDIEQTLSQIFQQTSP